MARLYAATGTSFARLDETPDGWAIELSLRDRTVQCLALDPGDPDTVYVGLGAGGVRKTMDGARTWIDLGLTEQQVFSVAVSAADGAVYAGMEPSALFRSDDEGGTWRELTGLLDLPSRATWSWLSGPFSTTTRPPGTLPRTSTSAPPPSSAQTSRRHSRSGR